MSRPRSPALIERRRTRSGADAARARAVRDRPGRRDRRAGRARPRAARRSPARRTGPTPRSSPPPASRPCSTGRAATARTPTRSGSAWPTPRRSRGAGRRRREAVPREGARQPRVRRRPRCPRRRATRAPSTPRSPATRRRRCTSLGGDGVLGSRTSRTGSGCPRSRCSAPRGRSSARCARTRDVKTLVAASAGNHGRAVAHVAAQRGLRCRIYLPARAVAARRAAIAGEGADVVVVDGTYEDAVARAAADGARPGRVELADVGASRPGALGDRRLRDAVLRARGGVRRGARAGRRRLARRGRGALGRGGRARR